MNEQTLQTKDFDFDLPEELIAQTPIEPRDASRLMVLDRKTGSIEHKHCEFGRDGEGNPLTDTVISREYSSAWQPGDEPYYPVNDERNNALYAQYAKLAAAEEGVTFAGRLGTYRYYDMAPCIKAALELAEALLGEKRP